MIMVVWDRAEGKGREQEEVGWRHRTIRFAPLGEIIGNEWQSELQACKQTEQA